MSHNLEPTYSPYISRFKRKFWTAFIAGNSEFPIPSEAPPSECNPYIQPVRAKFASLEIKLFVVYRALFVVYLILLIVPLSHAMKKARSAKRDVLRAVMTVESEERDKEIERLWDMYRFETSEDARVLAKRSWGTCTDNLGDGGESANRNVAKSNTEKPVEWV